MKKILLILPIICFQIQADSYTPSHSCSKPDKPYSFESQYEIESFKSEVEDYKRCIEDFIEEQNDEIENHKSAIEEATEEFNDFVNYELN